MPKTVFYPHTSVAASWFNTINGSRLDFSGTNANALNDGQYLKLRAADIDWKDSFLSAISHKASAFLCHQDMASANPLQLFVHGGIAKISAVKSIIVADKIIVLPASKSTKVWLAIDGGVSSGDEYPIDQSHIPLATITTDASNITLILDTRPDFIFSGGATAGDDGFDVGDTKYSARQTPSSDNWVKSVGQYFSPTEYPELFQAIGYTYGREAGGDRFRLPDGTDKFIKSTGNTALGATGGAGSLALTAANIPSHKHAITDPGHDHVGIEPAPHTHAASQESHTHAIWGWNSNRNDEKVDGFRGGDTAIAGEIGFGGDLGYITQNIAGRGLIEAQTPRVFVEPTRVAVQISNSKANISTTDNFGLGTPVDINPPFISLNLFIKVKSLKK